MNLGASAVAYSGKEPETSTWGGHPIYDQKTNMWHGYFAEMTNHCTLSSWTTNSIIVHAQSASPTGPFTFVSVVQPAWSHNPLVSRDPSTGDILIAHIGCGKIAAGSQPKNCSNTTADEQEERLLRRGPLPGLPPCECPHYGKLPAMSCQTLQVLRSASPDGPWVDETLAWPITNTSQWPSCLSNPTLLFPSCAGGKTLLGFNGNFAPPNNKGNTSHAGLAVSRGGWRGPYDLVNVSVAPATGEVRHYLDDHGHAEDEVLWRDHRGHIHMLMHGFYDEFPGGHGWTTDPDGITGWEFSATPAYTFAAHLNGKDVELSKRERPQVVIENGVITHLFHGARGPKGNPNPRGDTFSMVTEVCSHGVAMNGVCPPAADVTSIV